MKLVHTALCLSVLVYMFGAGPAVIYFAFNVGSAIVLDILAALAAHTK